MSFTATFYSFSKRKNSTKRPTGGGTSYNIVLKEPSTILNPRIELDRGNPAALNYCYIPTFNRYYFINDWVSDHDRWIANCTVDALASWRDSILNSTQFVARSASKKDRYIVNSEYVVTKDVDISNIELLHGLQQFPFDSSEVTYVLAVANNDPLGKVNGIQYLAMNNAQISAVMNSILNDNNTFGFGASEALFGLTGSVARALVDPLQYIGESYILPYDVTGQTTNISALKVGFWTLTHPGGQLKAITPNFPGNAIMKKEKTLTLAQHPQASTHGAYLNAYPYTEYRLRAGVFGDIVINVDDVIASFPVNGSGLDVTLEVRADMFGKAILTVFTTDEHVILARAYADVAVPFSLTQSKNNILSWAASLAGTGISIGSGNLASVGNIPGVINGLDNAFPKPEVKGQNHSAICNYERWYLETSHKRTVATEQITTNLTGDPLCEVINLSQLTGFCQCAGDIWFDSTCTDNEDEAIKSLMTSGFFIE